MPSAADCLLNGCVEINRESPRPRVNRNLTLLSCVGHIGGTPISILVQKIPGWLSKSRKPLFAGTEQPNNVFTPALKSPCIGSSTSSIYASRCIPIQVDRKKSQLIDKDKIMDRARLCRWFSMARKS